MAKIIKKEILPSLSIRDFYNKRNDILIWHEKGGLGDIYMHRMVFEDLQHTMPDAKIFFACLPEYAEAIKDHPYVYQVLDSRKVNPKDFVVCYNTCVTVADRHEYKRSPNCEDHRSDIWGMYCGVNLKNHNMHFKFDKELLINIKNKLNDYRKNEKALIGFAPISKMTTKTLLEHQIEAILEYTKDQIVLGLHKNDCDLFKRFGIDTIPITNLKEFAYYVNCLDYIISVDTAAFHLAGGLQKPLMGIFTFADGLTYGKYFDFILVQKHKKNGVWNCGPCFTFGNCPKSRMPQKPCLTEISPEDLKSGIDALFSRWIWDGEKIKHNDMINPNFSENVFVINKL